MSSSSNVFTSSLLRPLEAQLVEALSALNLAPETIRDGEIEPEDAVALIENHRTTLPCMTEVQWAAFKSAIRRLARTREGGSGCRRRWQSTQQLAPRNSQLLLLVPHAQTSVLGNCTRHFMCYYTLSDGFASRRRHSAAAREEA
jgi:hypothetical protein